ncbi:Acyl-coenzyme A amino acid N-acyltransferase 2 [Vulpes lagopus]
MPSVGADSCPPPDCSLQLNSGAGNTTPSLSQLPMVQLTATPASALADEPVHIQVTGLHPLQMVTLMASLKDEKGNVFWSRAFYKANEVGELDLMQTPAFGDVITDQVMASQVVERWFSGPGLQRVQIREGRVRGALFLPPGEGPFPGVIDLFGGRGGLVEFRASLLAARGFAVLALAYFAYEDLPSDLLEIDLEYFEEAANLLLAHPKVQTPGIGVISVSKGAEIGLAMACFLKQVVATIWINGTNAIFEFPLRYKDMVITPIPTFIERIQLDISGAMRLRHYKGDPWDELNQQSVLPIEKALGSILFIVGENDECLNSRAYAEQALHQLQSHGKNNGRMLSYPGAGHLIEPPYSPLCYASPNKNFSPPLLWGGDPAAHAEAQEHSWGEILKFFRQHLTQTRSTL